MTMNELRALILPLVANGVIFELMMPPESGFLRVSSVRDNTSHAAVLCTDGLKVSINVYERD